MSDERTALIVGSPILARRVTTWLNAVGITKCEVNGVVLETFNEQPPSPEATHRAPGPDCVVIIAGEPGPVSNERDWTALARAHLAYPDRLISRLIPGMVQRGRGLVVLAQYLPALSTAALSDLAAEEVVAGTRDFVQNLNSQYGPAGVHAIAIFVDTPSSVSEERADQGGNDDDAVAEVIAWCCTNSSASSITEMRVSSARDRY